MKEILSLEEFLKTPGTYLDVRSPGEFMQGRIPGAINLALFSDEERANIGTAYKQQGKEQAISLGLNIAGPKLGNFVEQAKTYCQTGLGKVYCWRGGMRSSAMKWLLGFSGIPAVTLQGGYKTFRRWVLKQFSHPYSFVVIGGLTGCGKTETLQALKKLGEQVLDLEMLAHHRGSSYGKYGEELQPSTEQFENEIALCLAAFHCERPIWIEDENRLIGTCAIPDSLFKSMHAAPLFVIERPLEERLTRLLRDYSEAAPDELIKATKKISKRLGSQRTKEIVEAIKEGRFSDAIIHVLKYYDAAYAFSLSKRSQPVEHLKTHCLSSMDTAAQLLKRYSHHKLSCGAYTNFLSEVAS